jgi:hypothetical protein
VVERIDHRAAREGLSRNQVIAAVLADYFAPADAPSGSGDGGRELPGARP